MFSGCFSRALSKIVQQWCSPPNAFSRWIVVEIVTLVNIQRVLQHQGEKNPRIYSEDVQFFWHSTVDRMSANSGWPPTNPSISSEKKPKDLISSSNHDAWHPAKPQSGRSFCCRIFAERKLTPTQSSWINLETPHLLLHLFFFKQKLSQSIIINQSSSPLVGGFNPPVGRGYIYNHKDSHLFGDSPVTSSCPNTGPHLKTWGSRNVHTERLLKNGWLEYDRLSYWGGLFSGAMLVSGRVSVINICLLGIPSLTRRIIGAQIM